MRSDGRAPAPVEAAVMTPGEPLGGPEPWPAPGKLNLFLHVTGRRADGYHLLQTAFQFIDLCDELRFWQRPAGVIERLGEAARRAGRGRPVRAGRAAAAPSGRRARGGVAIEVRKRIPMQGGLGGGSSDAATVLVALNELWGLRTAGRRTRARSASRSARTCRFSSRPGGLGRGRGRATDAARPARARLPAGPARRRGQHGRGVQAPELTRDSPVITIRGFLTDGRPERLRTGRAAALSRGG